MNKTVTPEKVRELIDIAVGAFTVHDDSISNMDNAVIHVMGWLEQNPIEPLVVGLSDAQIDGLVDFIETGEFKPEVNLKTIIEEWLKTKTFAHDEQYHVNWDEVCGDADFVIHKKEVYDTEGNLLQCVNLNTTFKPKPTPHVEANAKLIAAAPDLLELLQIATELMSVNQSDNLRRIEVWYDMAQSAIAKATGE
jgi:hypothetical protein